MPLHVRIDSENDIDDWRRAYIKRPAKKERVEIHEDLMQ